MIAGGEFKMRDDRNSNRARLQSLIASALTAGTVSVATVALLQTDGVFSSGLVLMSLGAALMVAVCLFADSQ